MTDKQKIKEIQDIVATTVITINTVPDFMKDDAKVMGFNEVVKACKWHLEGKSYSTELEKEIEKL